MISLIPVLELEPGQYSLIERVLPDGSMFENPAGWYAYWSACLADSGIHNLEPWRPGSWLVPVARLTDPATLLTILRKHVEDVSRTDELGMLLGGYILSSGDRELRPGCCGDLSNLADWRQALANAGDAWQMLWIGHPWSFVRRSGERIQIAQPSEATTPEGAAEAFSVTTVDLGDAIESAEREVHAFAARLLPLIVQLQPSIPAAEVVNTLLGIEASD